MAKALCSAKGCIRQARFECVDNLEPLTERKGVKACARHGLLWYRQGRGSIWVFPLGDDEATALSEAEIIAAVDESPLPRQ